MHANWMTPETRLSHAHTISLGGSYEPIQPHWRDLLIEVPYEFEPRLMDGEPGEEIFPHHLEDMIKTDYPPTEYFWLGRLKHAMRVQ